jgi:hypothetical protein
MSNTDFTTEAQRHGENPKEGRAKLHIVSSSKEQGTEIAEGTEKMRPVLWQAGPRPVSQAPRARRGLEMSNTDFTTEAQRHRENPKEGCANPDIVSSPNEQGTEVGEGTEKMGTE